MMADTESTIDGSGISSADSMMAIAGQVDANEVHQQRQPDENKQGSDNAVTATVATAIVAEVGGVGTGAYDKNSNDAGNGVDDNYDDDDKSSDDIPLNFIDDEETQRMPRNLQKRRFVTLAIEYRSKLQGMPREVLQRTLPEMYSDYLRSDTRQWYPWCALFCQGFTECFRYVSKPGHRDLCPPLQIDWVNETIAFQGDHHGKLHLNLDNWSARLIHFMDIEDIKKFARICLRCSRLTSILLSYDVKYDQKMSYFLLEAAGSSVHSRLARLELMCCGCRMSTWLESVITFVQSFTTLTTINLNMHDSEYTSRASDSHQVTSMSHCVDCNRTLLDGVVQCKSLRELILFPPVHEDDPAFIPMVEAMLIRRRDMQGQGLVKLQYDGARCYDAHTRLSPETARVLMEGALSGSVERLEISRLMVDGSTIAQLAEAARGTPLESKLSLKHLQMMDIQFDSTIDGAETSESMSDLLSNLPCLEYVAINHRYLIPQSLPQAPAPFVCFYMDELPQECLDSFFELLPSSAIRALHVGAYFNIPDVLRLHLSSFQGLRELHIDERVASTDHDGNRTLISLLFDVLDHNTNIVKCSCITFDRVRHDDELNHLCRRNRCIQILQSSFGNKPAYCLMPAALAYLGRISRNHQSSSLSTSSSDAVVTTTVDLSALAVFTFFQMQQLGIHTSTNMNE